MNNDKVRDLRPIKPFDALVAVFLAMACGTILSFAASYIPLPSDISIYLQYAMTQVGLLGSVIVYLKVAKVDCCDMPIKRAPKPFAALLTPLMAVGALALLMILNYLAVYTYDALGLSVGVAVPAWNSWYDVVLAIVCICLLPAVGEETLFRGVTLRAQQVWGDKGAILIAAFVFSLFHFNLAQLVYQFAYALFLGYVVVKSGNLWYGVMLHFFNNLFVQILSLFPAVDALSTFSWGNIGVLACIACAGFGITVVSTLLFFRAAGDERKLQPYVRPEDRLRKENLIWSGGLLTALAIIWLVMVISNIIGVV